MLYPFHPFCNFPTHNFTFPSNNFPHIIPSSSFPNFSFTLPLPSFTLSPHIISPHIVSPLPSYHVPSPLLSPHIIFFHPSNHFLHPIIVLPLLSFPQPTPNISSCPPIISHQHFPQPTFLQSPPPPKKKSVILKIFPPQSFPHPNNTPSNFPQNTP